MVESELALISDARVTAYIRQLLVEPAVMMRGWDYGSDGDQYPCWTVLRHVSSNTGIVYCEFGFGPRSPWGLVKLEGDEAMTSIGMDSGWFTSFLQAFFDSFAATNLPIWQVVKTDLDVDEVKIISGEGDWDETWAKIMDLRKSDPASGYSCCPSVTYEKE